MNHRGHREHRGGWRPVESGGVESEEWRVERNGMGRDAGISAFSL